MDKSGRRPLITASASGTFLGCFMIGIAFFLKDQNLLLEFVPILAVAGILVLQGELLLLDLVFMQWIFQVSVYLKDYMVIYQVLMI